MGNRPDHSRPFLPVSVSRAAFTEPRSVRLALTSLLHETMTPAVTLLAAALLAAPTAAQFDLLGWTLVEGHSSSYTDLTVDGDMLVVSGPYSSEPCLVPTVGYAVTTAPFDATVTVRLSFLPVDPMPLLDSPLYVINGAKHSLPGNCADCEVVFHVQAGDIFGFGNNSVECFYGASVSTWTKLRLIPEPKATSVTEASPSAEFGQAVAGIGDVDLDGVPDVAVGAPHAAAAGPDSGRVVVLSGADASLLFAVDGASAGLLFGFAVAGVGDVSGDGIPDLLVGAPNASFSDNLSGRYYLLSGAGGAVIAVRDGTKPGANFGQAVAGPGDVDGDGTPDLLVGAPGKDAFPPSAGRATLHSGRTSDVLLAVNGSAVGDQCGFAVAGANDMNGDGVLDLLVGSRLASPGGQAGAGTVFAVSGATGALLLTLEGDAAGDQFGSSVAGLADLDADGVPEIAVGAPYADGALDDAGSVTVHSGAMGAVLHSATGAAASDRLGFAVAAAGDVDDDGLTDVLAGAIGSGGLDPGASGTARILSGRDGCVLALFGGNVPGDQFGNAVASAGDLDGDLLVDIVVGAPGADDLAPEAGKVTFFSGIHVIWANLGGGVAGVNDTPMLAGKSLLVAGGPLALSVQGSTAGAPLTLVLGLFKLGAPFKGGVLWPAPDILFSGLIVGAGGALTIAGSWPAGVPAGVSFFIQAWIPDVAASQGFSATNGLRGRTP